MGNVSDNTFFSADYEDTVRVISVPNRRAVKTPWGWELWVLTTFAWRNPYHNRIEFDATHQTPKISDDEAMAFVVSNTLPLGGN